MIRPVSASSEAGTRVTPADSRNPFRHLPMLPIAIILGLALRVAAAIVVPNQQFPDAIGYRAAGLSLWATGRISEPLFMPLYPALVGLTGPGFGQLALDVALSTVMIWLVHRLALAMFGDRAAAALAALAAAVYPFFIFYAVVGLTETLYITLLLGAFDCWYRGYFTPAAVLAVLSILTRPTLDPLIPLLILCFALVVHRMPVGAALRQLAVYAAIYCVLMSPWWLHNYRAYGTFVRLSLGSGVMLYTGNNPLNRSGGALEADRDPTRFDKIADPLTRDRAMWNAGADFIKQNPGRFIELAIAKFMRFWRPWPYAQDYAAPLYVILSLASFAPVLGLAIVYLAVWGWRERAVIAPVILLAGCLTAVHMVLAASMRYRLPLEPFLIIMAATAVARLIRRYEPKPPRAITAVPP
jgi:4-amino-4-deoxy-L-arabinose transferase-like glycosyltransferase